MAWKRFGGGWVDSPAYTGIPEFGHWHGYFPPRDFTHHMNEAVFMSVVTSQQCCLQVQGKLHSLPPTFPSDGLCRPCLAERRQWISNHIHLISYTVKIYEGSPIGLYYSVDILAYNDWKFYTYIMLMKISDF